MNNPQNFQDCIRGKSCKDVLAGFVGTLYLLLFGIVLGLAVGWKQMYIPVTSSYWIEYPNSVNTTGLMAKEVVGYIGLGIPVALSFLVSACVNVGVFLKVLQNHRDSETGRSWSISIARATDDFSMYVATYVDLSLIAGLTDVVHIIYVVALVACASTLNAIAADQLLHMPSCSFRYEAYNTLGATRNVGKYLIPMMAAVFFTIVPWIGIVWYYARARNQSESVTALISSAAVITVVWRVVNIIEHVYADKKLQYLDALITVFMFASSVSLGLATFFIFAK